MYKRKKEGWGGELGLWGSEPFTGHFKVQNHYRHSNVQCMRLAISYRSLEEFD